MTWRHWLVGSILYIIFIGILYTRFGILQDGEAQKYIYAAESILFNGDFRSLLNHWLYSTYILLLTILFALGFSINSIIVLQLGLNLLCAYLLYHTIIKVTGNERISGCVAFIYLFCVPIQEWTLALYTESFFVDIIIIYCFCLVISEEKRFIPLVILFGFALSFCRPVGIFIALSGLVVIANRFQQNLKSKIVSSIIVTICLVFISGFFLPIDCENVAIPIYQGSIIYGYPQWQETSLLTPPCNLIKVYTLMVNEFGFMEVLKTGMLRVISLYSLHRPYYSLAHNFILSIYYLIYILAAIGLLFSKSTFKGFRCFFFLSICFISLTSAFTHDEWSSRFLVPILFLLTLFAASGLQIVLLRIKSRLT